MLQWIILDSERSEECIDFTMIITSRNNAPISNFGGGFRCKSEYPWCIIEFSKKIEKNKKKMTKNRNFYAKPVFDQIDFFLWFFLRIMHILMNQFKLLINVFYSSIICDSGQSILTLGNHNALDGLLVILKEVKNSNFYEICRKRENLQYKSCFKNLLMTNDKLEPSCKKLVIYVYLIILLIEKCYKNDKCISVICLKRTQIITSRNNMLKLQTLGDSFRCKSEYPWCIIEVKS
ncbi:Uncharacterized protein FWK35_00004748, partial [Aphis craccivora]